MKKMKIFSVIVLCSFSVGFRVDASSMPTEEFPNSDVPEFTLEFSPFWLTSEHVIVTPNENEITVGDQKKLTATLTSASKSPKVSWSSSYDKIATVSDEGIVTAHANGTVSIIATTHEGHKASARFIIKKKVVEAADIILSSNTLSLTSGEESRVIAEITPANTTNQKIMWASNNTDIVTVDSNVIFPTFTTLKGVRPGSASVTATTSNGISKTINVTVKDNVASTNDVYGVYITETTYLPRYLGKPVIQMKAKTLPENASNNLLTWQSSDSSIATVTSAGEVRFHKTGEVTISAYSHNGKYDSVSYSVGRVPNLIAVPINGSLFQSLNSFY